MTTTTEAKRQTGQSLYRAAHDAVRALRGKAHEHLCADDCGQQAQEWALRPKSECIGTLRVVRVWSGEPRWYSDCTADYRPLALSCHRQADADEREAETQAVEGVLNPDPYREEW